MPYHASSAEDMAQPVLVRAYTGGKEPTNRPPPNVNSLEALPPISSYAFAHILRSVDSSRDFQIAIDGIAEIAAKTRMSLADEYASHLPPLGEITVASATSARAQVPRPGMRRVLTSVPEASSGSSEGSRKSARKRGGLFGFRKQQKQECRPMRQIRIGRMGRSIPVSTTTSLAVDVSSELDRSRSSSATTVIQLSDSRATTRSRALSAAQASLRQLLTSSRFVRDA